MNRVPLHSPPGPSIVVTNCPGLKAGKTGFTVGFQNKEGGKGCKTTSQRECNKLRMLCDFTKKKKGGK